MREFNCLAAVPLAGTPSADMYICICLCMYIYQGIFIRGVEHVASTGKKEAAEVREFNCLAAVPIAGTPSADMYICI